MAKMESMKIIAKPIAMVAMFDSEGLITPYKFKLQTKDGALETYYVGSIKNRQSRKYAGIDTIEFECDFEMNDVIRECVSSMA